MPKFRDIARVLGVELAGVDAEREIRRVDALDAAGPDDLSYIASDRYTERFQQSRAGVILAGAKLKLPDKPDVIVIRVPDAELAIAQVLPLFAPPTERATGVHASAVIDPTATVAAGATVGPNVSVGPHAVVGAGTWLHANVAVGAHVRIGSDCEIYSGVVLREHVVVGDRVILHANAVIGTDGFGYRWDGKRHVKVPQIGIVVIEDDVEVGSNTCIDRAKFGETRIGRGTKIDNLVQVGHNVRTGAHCILCGQVGIAGSTTLGIGVVMGGGSAAKDHVNIADGTQVAAFGGVGRDTTPREILAGSPAVPHRDWLKERVNVQRLPELMKMIKRLEAEIEALKKA